MTYRLYNTEQGDFCIDWEACCQMIRSFHRATAQYAHSREVTESQSSLLNPLSWGLPDLTTVEVDWARVQNETTTKALYDAHRLAAFAVFNPNGVDGLVRELKRMREETRKRNELLSQATRRASTRSWAAMEQSVSSYGSLIDNARLVRDLSGTVLIGAATAATGGAAGAALTGAGLGTSIKAVAKYQDTGSVGSAAIEAAQNVVFSVFPAARGASLVGREKLVKVLVSSIADSAKAIVEGRELGTALLEGAVNVPAACLGEAGKKLLAPVLGKVALPVVTKIVTTPNEVASKLPIEIAKKTIEDRAKKWGQQEIKGHLAGANGPAERVARKPTKRSDSFVNSLAFEDELVLKFAVIDMEKGVGHSWW
jgi:hypothetical protein